MNQKIRLKHYKQIEVLDDPTRFKFVVAGRRGGKTKMVVEDILQSAYSAEWAAEFFYIGPTNAQAYEIIWNEIEERLRELRWEYEPLVSKRRFELSKKRKIYVIGAEKIRRIRGHKVKKAYLDEVAFFTVPLSEVWRAVRPALSDLIGGAILTTTPDGKNADIYDFYLENKNKENWKYFLWRTVDNPYISRAEIEEAKKELDEKSFRQEYEATWESFEGLAYYSYNMDKNVAPNPELIPNLPVDLALDFNVNPTTILVCQSAPLMAYVKREYSLKNSSTIDTVKAFIQDFYSKRNDIRLRIFGDAAGNNRSSNTGKSDYFYLKDLLTQSGFKFEFCVPSKNPAIVDRVMHMNSWLNSFNGNSRITIDPSCKELIRDLSSQELDGRAPVAGKNNLGHKADALGYYINWLQTMDSRKKQGTVQL